MCYQVNAVLNRLNVFFLRTPASLCFHCQVHCGYEHEVNNFEKWKITMVAFRQSITQKTNHNFRHLKVFSKKKTHSHFSDLFLQLRSPSLWIRNFPECILSFLENCNNLVWLQAFYIRKFEINNNRITEI